MGGAEAEGMVARHLPWAKVLLTPHLLGTLKVLGKLEQEWEMRERRRGTNTRVFFSWFSLREHGVLATIREKLMDYDPPDRAGLHGLDMCTLRSVVCKTVCVLQCWVRGSEGNWRSAAYRLVCRVAELERWRKSKRLRWVSGKPRRGGKCKRG